MLGTMGLASALIAYERRTILEERALLAEERRMLCEERRAVVQELQVRPAVVLNPSNAAVEKADVGAPQQMAPSSTAEPIESHGVSSHGVLPMARGRSQTLRSSCSSFGGAASYPPVVISYQSNNFEFMVRLRDRLEDVGIETIDGSRTPAGKDWRKFYFTALSRATIFLPILSENYLGSRACEDGVSNALTLATRAADHPDCTLRHLAEITYAWDKRKIFVPVLAKFKEYQAVMQSPSDFTESLRDDMDEALLLVM